jgi:hypothetical protein
MFVLELFFYFVPDFIQKLFKKLVRLNGCEFEEMFEPRLHFILPDFGTILMETGLQIGDILLLPDLIKVLHDLVCSFQVLDNHQSVFMVVDLHELLESKLVLELMIQDL